MNSQQFIRKSRHFSFNLCLFLLSLTLIPVSSQTTDESVTTKYNSTILLQDIEVTKRSTSFDGTNKDGAITYMRLNGENGVQTVMGAASALFDELDYTFMIWLKPEENVWSRHL